MIKQLSWINQSQKSLRGIPRQCSHLFSVFSNTAQSLLPLYLSFKQHLTLVPQTHRYKWASKAITVSMDIQPGSHQPKVAVTVAVGQVTVLIGNFSIFNPTACDIRSRFAASLNKPSPARQFHVRLDVIIEDPKIVSSLTDERPCVLLVAVDGQRRRRRGRWPRGR